ncbi:MAG: type III-B CRISPR module RAMP protein Cmr4 [Thermoplasmataceae archaeon]
MIKKDGLIIGMMAETQVHVGSGEAGGFVDLPFTRESTTSYPTIPGSSLKGAFRDMIRRNNNDELSSLFGDQNKAGDVVFSDARLLLLPVRSLLGNYRWTTCPYLIERLERDLIRVGNLTNKERSAIQISKNCVYSKGQNKLFLEEREFNIKGEVPDEIVGLIKEFIPNASSQKRLSEQITLLSNDDFKWFAQYGLQINSRNALNDETKTTEKGALWYEETIPPDSVFYTVIFSRTKGKDMNGFIKILDEHPYIQIGGNETIGQGWFHIITKFGGDMSD